MVVIGVEGSMLLQSVHHIPRLQSTTSSSPLFSSSQQQQHYRGLSSSSASYSGSSSSSVSFPHLTYSSSSSSSSASVGDTAIQRRISIGGAPRSKSRETIAGIGYGGAVAVANPSRPAIAYRPAAFVSGPSARVVHAAVAETSGEGLKWWEKGGAPNMVDVHSTHEFLNALSAAGDKLVIVKFYATWCGSCRALFPKFSKMATEYTDVNFLKVNFDENKPMCKSLNIKVLPFFHIYRGSEGRLESFSASLSKLQKLKDAISKHHDGPCEDCAPPELLGDVFASLQERASAERAAGAAGSSE